MSKLLSDEEIIYELQQYQVQAAAEHRSFEWTQSKLLNLINTQKRLYAESVMEDHRCPRPISRGNKSYGAGI